MTEFLVELSRLISMIAAPVLWFVVILLWSNVSMAAKRDDELGEALRRVRGYLWRGERGENRWLMRIVIVAFVLLVLAGMVVRVYG